MTRRLGVVATLLLLATAMLSGLAPAQAGAQQGPPIRSNVWVPPHTAVFDSQNNEWVDLTGKLHLSADVSDSATDLYANLADTSGVGRTTGQSYRATGADKITISGPPIRVRWNPSFNLIPSAGSNAEQNGPPIKVAIGLDIAFSESHQISNVDVVSGHST